MFWMPRSSRRARQQYEHVFLGYEGKRIRRGTGDMGEARGKWRRREDTEEAK